MKQTKKFSQNLVDAVETSFRYGDYRSGFVNLVRSLFYHDLIDFRTAVKIIEVVNEVYGDYLCQRKRNQTESCPSIIRNQYNSAFHSANPSFEI